MNYLKQASALFLAITFASILGCAATEKRSSTGEYITDSWITTKVKAALVKDPVVKASEVNVETFKGTVQLSGFVSNDAAKSQAVVVTRGIEGVTGVRNDIRIR
jgi:osmotically-inducible protein OsmY